MAIKKGMFQNYVKKQNEERKKRQIKANQSKYSHNKVYETDIQDEVKETKEEVTKVILEKPIKQKKVLKKEHVKKEFKEEPVKQNNINVSLGDVKRNLFTLTGIQQKLFFELLNLAHQKGNNLIEQITNIDLQELTETSHGNIKLAIHRLVKKGLLERYKGKTSKFGYYNLGFKNDVYKLSLEFAQDMGLLKTQIKVLEKEV